MASSRYGKMLVLLSLAVVVVVSQEVPSFAVTPQDTSAAVNYMVTIYCTIANLGGYQVYWDVVHNASSGFTLGPNSNGHASYPRFAFVGDVSEGEFNLRISDVQQADAGMYVCLVHDPSDAMSVANEAGARLTVFDNTVAPLISGPQCDSTPEGDTGNGVFKQGDVITLTCTAQGGIPLPELEWERIKEDVVINKLPGKTTVRGDMVTTSTEVDLTSLDHQSHYKCVETHPSSSNPRICETGPDMRVRFKPEVSLTPNQVYVQLLETTHITLRCKAYGYPDLSSGPTIVLPANRTGTFSEDKSSVELELTTDDVDKDFYCLAINELGVGEAKLVIKQQSLPPTWLTLVIIGCVGVVLLIFITIVVCALCVDRSKIHDDQRQRTKDRLRYSVNKSRPTSLRREGEDDFIDGYNDEDFEGGRETLGMRESTKTVSDNDFETGEAGPRYQNVNEAFQADDFQSNSLSNSNPSSSEPIIIDSNFE